MGSKKNAFYRIVVMDSRKPRDGRSVDELGIYDPKFEEIRVNEERAKMWLGRGAQPSETVVTLFRRMGVMECPAGYTPKPVSQRPSTRVYFTPSAPIVTAEPEPAPAKPVKAAAPAAEAAEPEPAPAAAEEPTAEAPAEVTAEPTEAPAAE